MRQIEGYICVYSMVMEVLLCSI